jgi:hypothetical protein
MFATSAHPAQGTASAHRREATMDGAQTDPARVGPTREALIQWVSVYGDEVVSS